MLFAYNKTTSPLPLAAGAVTLPASRTAGHRGPQVNVTGKLQGASPAEFAAIQVQVTAGQVDVEWSEFEEYPTPGLVPFDEDSRAQDVTQTKATAAVATVAQSAAAGVASIAHDPGTLYSKSIELVGEHKTGGAISIPVFGLNYAGRANPIGFAMEIVSTEFRLRRGAPDAKVYLCCNELGRHHGAPLSDEYSATNGEVMHEQVITHQRVLDGDHKLFLICTNDYVQGTFRITYHKAADGAAATD